MNDTWTKCKEKMPPDSDVEIYIRKVNHSEVHYCEAILTPANEIWFDIDPNEIDLWEWCYCVGEM